jgi:hypothetical protein
MRASVHFLAFETTAQSLIHSAVVSCKCFWELIDLKCHEALFHPIFPKILLKSTFFPQQPVLLLPGEEEWVSNLSLLAACGKTWIGLGKKKGLGNVEPSNHGKGGDEEALRAIRSGHLNSAGFSPSFIFFILRSVHSLSLKTSFWLNRLPKNISSLWLGGMQCLPVSPGINLNTGGQALTGTPSLDQVPVPGWTKYGLESDLPWDQSSRWNGRRSCFQKRRMCLPEEKEWVKQKTRI